MSSYLFAFMALAAFSFASIIFTEFTGRTSSIFVNLAKAIIASILFWLTSLILYKTGNVIWEGEISQPSIYFILSGALGLGIGDIFLLRAFHKIGPSRTLMIYSFQPLFIGIQAAFFLDQPFSYSLILPIGLLVACVLIISFEQSKKSGSWQWNGILFAIIGVFLDNTGVILTRKAFDLSHTHPMLGNAIRATSASLVLLVIALLATKKQTAEHLHPWTLQTQLRSLSSKLKYKLFIGAFFGTFISLACWLTAIKSGHLASLTAIGGLSPLAISIWEWLLHKKRPSPTFWICFVISFTGVILLLNAG